MIEILSIRQSFMTKLTVLNKEQPQSNDLEKVNEIFKETLFLGKYLENLQKNNLQSLRNLL